MREKNVMKRSAEQDEDDRVAAKEPRDEAIRLDCFKDRTG